MKKKAIDTSALQNELQGASLFFQKQEAAPSEPPHQPVLQLSRQEETQDSSRQASITASTLASTDEDIVARIRKIVRTPGKDVSYVRLTAEEKQQLADIVYTYKRQGVKTSENEINRIAVNFMLEDYRANGASSILVKVIEALLA